MCTTFETLVCSPTSVPFKRSGWVGRAKRKEISVVSKGAMQTSLLAMSGGIAAISICGCSQANLDNPLRVFPNSATSIEYSLDGNILYLISNGSVVQLAPNSEYREAASVRLKFDDPRVATGELHPAQSGELILQRSGECWIITPETGEAERTSSPQLHRGEESIDVVAASADGTRIVTHTLPVKVDIALVSLKLWDVKNQTKLWEKLGITMPIAHFSPTSNSALIAFNSAVAVIDETGNERLIEHDRSIMTVGADWGKNRVIVADGASGLASYSFEGKLLWRTTRGTSELTVSPRSDVIATATGMRVYLLDASSGREVGSFEVVGKSIHDFAIHPSKKQIAVGADSGVFIYSY